MKISLAKKHPLTKAEALPIAKKKKIGKWQVTLKAVLYLHINPANWTVVMELFQMPPYHLKLQHRPVKLQTEPRASNDPQLLRNLCQLNLKELVGWNDTKLLCNVDQESKPTTDSSLSCAFRCSPASQHC